MPATSTPDDSTARAVFHEATLLNVDDSAQPAALILRFDGVRLDDVPRTATLTFTDVAALRRDGLATGRLPMEMPDAEVVALRQSGPGTWQLILLWNDFPRRQSRTVAYEIDAAGMRTAFPPEG